MPPWTLVSLLLLVLRRPYLLRMSRRHRARFRPSKPSLLAMTDQLCHVEGLGHVSPWKLPLLVTPALLPRRLNLRHRRQRRRQ
jgi:hypothetical protein